jgi:hypothetical protein
VRDRWIASFVCDERGGVCGSDLKEYRLHYTRLGVLLSGEKMVNVQDVVRWEVVEGGCASAYKFACGWCAMTRHEVQGVVPVLQC